MADGYIYILLNPAFKDKLKIGFTEGDPEERARQLSSTGVPSKFVVAYAEYVGNCAHVERLIHEHLSEHRVSFDREFFELPLASAIRTVSQIVTPFLKELATCGIALSQQNCSSTELTTPRITSVSDADSSPPPISTLGFERTKAVRTACGRCGTDYSVTLVRGENHTLCPSCRMLSPANLRW